MDVVVQAIQDRGREFHLPDEGVTAAAQQTAHGLTPDEINEMSLTQGGRCLLCVVAECREFGMGEIFGVWGGLTERERRLRRPARRLRETA